MSSELNTVGDVAVITLKNPPVNALSYPMRKAVMSDLAAAMKDERIKAIVLIGQGKGFCGGADIHEFDTPEAGLEPTAWTVIDALEQSAKPVIAAIHGICMGGGFELALGCHYRVAAKGTQFAFPEVKLGILPGAGGTQRLPRVIGVEHALNMIVSGAPVPAEMLAAIPKQTLIDALSNGIDTLLDDAIVLATRMIAVTPPKIRDLPCEQANAAAYFQFARNMTVPGLVAGNAVKYCIQCVEAAATQSFQDGMKVEHELFMRLLASSEFRALKHVFLAEKMAGKVEGISRDTPQREIRRVGVVGGGLMGTGIAMNFLNAGIPVTLLEVSQEALDRGVKTIAGNYASQLKKGKLDQAKLDARMALLTPALSYDALADADLTIEAVFETLAIKETVFKALDAVMKPGAILASNTSTLDLNKIAGFTRRPQDVVGLHFFSPANIMKLLEVVQGDQTADDVMATVMALAGKIRKTAVVSGVCDGFIGNRMIEELLRQAGFLIDEGASPHQIDKAMEKFGMAMGPYRVADMAGNDISWAIRQRRAVERPELRYSEIGNRLYESGRHGVKTGGGWYDYLPGRRDPQPSRVMEEIIRAHRDAIGIRPRKIDEQEIVQRLVYALVNEGARILEEGIASRASDIDMVYILGYGFPAWKGGPMHYANEQGLSKVVRTMQSFAQNPQADPAFWQPAPAIERLAEHYDTF
jgi:3-hydroxyacyl-CoA dehydrogenase